MHCQDGDDIAEYIVKLWAEPGPLSWKTWSGQRSLWQPSGKDIGYRNPRHRIRNIEPEFYLSQPGDSDKAELLRASSGLNLGAVHTWCDNI